MSEAIFQTWSVQRIAEECGGEVRGCAWCRVAGISNDSRTTAPANLFVALRGQRDGHEFIDQARNRGSRCFLVERGREPEVLADEAAIVVADTYQALIRLGSALWREHGRLRPDRIAIALTGSNGKTTSKNLIERLLQEATGGPILATRGNLNNHIGLPMMLAELAPDHRFTVLEMGASRPGDIDQLIAMAPADRALVTTISPAHLQGFTDIDGVAREKGRIFCGKPAAGVAVLPQRWCEQGLLPPGYEGEVRTFGTSPGSCIQLVDFQGDTPTVAHYAVRMGADQESSRLKVALNLPGEHNALNLAACVGVVWDLLPADRRSEVVARVASQIQPVAGRTQWVQSPRGYWVLDDSYNANPGSMRAALEVHRQRPGRRWAIFGDMLELGEQAGMHHRLLGRDAARSGCVRIWGVGQMATELLSGARSEGVADLAWFSEAGPCAEAARESAREGDVILVKGSRSIHLEQVVAALLHPVETGGAEEKMAIDGESEGAI
ncbi:MAG: UDP-N-acetylmuramoyl-tripeptide--D-alanyl-D-alanine ligase [Bradymonadales bacterium]|nr:UDP-N-acetylmuramoyl-tripeptide--D-alanyl-D-alanine ligase [Bradymonadales bacterium]